ncbi:ATP-binding cassette domain-containing protein [soil metagenome]
MTITRSAPPIASLRHVSYWFPHTDDPILRGVNWNIEKGEFIVLSGPSGSGKSTLLRTLNGLVPHFSGGRFAGEAIVDGKDTRLVGPRGMSSSVGFVFQDPEAQSVATIVEDDIAFGLEQAGIPRPIMRKRVEEVLDLLGIANLRRRAIATLSGGERQRVAVASALVMHPGMLVLDEPTSQLDPWGAEGVLTALHRLNEDLGITVVLAEHRLDRVGAYADRLRVLSANGETFEGSPAESLRKIPVEDLPPVARLAIALEWPEIPLTVKAARQYVPVLEPRPSVPIVPPAAPPIVEVDRVTVERERSTILSGVSLSVRPGEIVAIMGRNGSGKTTLLRSMLGLSSVTSGSVVVAGRDVSHGASSDLAGIVAYLPQDPAKILFAESVRAELAFTLQHRPKSLARPARSPEELLMRLDLAHLADRHPRDLSVGERERTAIAAVLVTSPQLILLDEPTRGMDGARKSALAEILEEERSRGAAIILATHDVELVAEYATRVILMAEGEIIADGQPEETLAGSLTFSTQVNKLFGGNLLTVQQVVDRTRGL